MLTQSTIPEAHGSEVQASTVAGASQYWSTDHPEYDAKSLAELASQQANQWLRPGDVVYVSEVRRHVLTEGDLNQAARAVIGGAQ